MQLAGRVFDVLTAEGNRHPSIQFPDRDTLIAWRKYVRLAALFHDLGHLPFSHAAEEQLLPDGKHHEWLTVAVLRSPQMIRTHHPLDAANARVMIDPVDGDTPLAPCLAQRFQRDVESDLLSIFEKVDHGLGDTVDANRLAFQAMDLDSLTEGCSAEAGNAQ